ncbi:hypothetical protein FA09DRAFT_329397 [Tilletiopsis washingtonensis]|uniref:Exoribonuclease phosphorolytic domain-containing protein n=1 Tax=Tilletiopsis washingtonensis TaxID=58919 RepID=A0A316ZF02_9BASI|nr:hypothetical protein FA09DRAFT_329397 [Tilletiopsis washingtonensis]PWN98925.1 hypothetical protein FA09DRAFT_329397 [Tilletiopsis washingtonensis]
MAHANLDRRRANGPETMPPLFMPAAPIAPRSRAPTAARPLFIKSALIPQANGSAYLEAGGLKLAAAVYGPRQARQKAYSQKADVVCEVRVAPFAIAGQRRRPGKDVESPSLSLALRSALLPSLRLRLLPKASVDIYVTILEADAGSMLLAQAGAEGAAAGASDIDDALLPAAATAASVALADAGIEMWGLVVGASLILDRKGTMLLDPTRADAVQARASARLCSMPALGAITSIEMAGDLTPDESDAAITMLQQACADMHLVAARAVKTGFETREEDARGAPTMIDGSQ